MVENREQEALDAYIRLLQNKGATPDMLQRRKVFLQQLMPILSKKPLDGGEYRDRVETLLDSLDKADWPLYQAVAREYYPFWTKDIKAIAALNADSGFDLAEVPWAPLEVNLKTLWNLLDKEQFSIAENWPLKAYSQALRAEGAQQATVNTRIKLVKLQLVRLRDAPEKNHKVYRAAVDATVPLFSMRDTRQFFLLVAREFYYFWIGDPDAANYIVLGRTGAIN